MWTGEWLGLETAQTIAQTLRRAGIIAYFECSPLTQDWYFTSSAPLGTGEAWLLASPKGPSKRHAIDDLELVGEIVAEDAVAPTSRENRSGPQETDPDTRPLWRGIKRPAYPETSDKSLEMGLSSLSISNSHNPLEEGSLSWNPNRMLHPWNRLTPASGDQSISRWRMSNHTSSPRKVKLFDTSVLPSPDMPGIAP